MGLNLEYTTGQTPLDEDEKSGLIISSISTREELDEFEQLNIEKAIQWYFRKKLTIEQLFSERFVKELHKKMFGEVWKWAGKFRTSEKNIGIKSYLIPIELKMLLDDVKFWIQNEIYEPEEIAIRCKHRLVSIHCFPNGNGRHSRLMADLIMQKIFHQHFFTWGNKRLAKVSEVRSNYIKALQSADLLNIKLLIEFAKS
jgi:Fic-DOC domain mobile mystery protein B